jgi:TRAP-type C4-dicarboxylate transport system substrate-binding protein
MSLPVYSRAGLSRTVALVVALSLTAVSTGAAAREFRAADTQIDDCPIVQAPRYIGGMIAENSGGCHQTGVFHSRRLGEEKETIEQARAGAVDLNRSHAARIEAVMAGIDAKAQRGPAAARLIERIRKVE